MARYKYSENTKEVTDIYFDTETHGEFMGMEQGGKMKKVSLPLLQDKIVEEITGDLNSHEADTTNPHEVTKEQVGLDEVDNTSDADKPVSTAQRNAINELAGTGRTTETVKQNADDIVTKESIENVNTLKGTGWAGQTVKGNADAIATLNADDATEGSVLKDIKDNAKDATYDNSTSGLTAETLGGAIDEVEGRVDTAEGEIDDLQTAETDIKGNGWTDENLVDHEDRLDTLEADSATEGSVAKSIKDAVDLIKGTGWTDENLVDHETRITSLEAYNPINSWQNIQEILRQGRIKQYLSVGDQFMAEYNSAPTIFNVIGIDHPGLVPTDPRFTHTLALQTQDCLFNAQFSAPQAIYGSTEELPAGTYIFTLDGVQYTFTSTESMPANGVLVGGGWTDYVPSTITIYGANRRDVIESGIVVTTTSGTDNLTPINNHARCRYGSNNPVDNAMRQFLNSNEAVFNWEPQGLYDMPSSYSGTGGFLYQLDPELVAVMGEVENKVALSTYDGGEQATVRDKAFLLSRVEVGLGTEGVTTGESVYEFYDGVSDANRIKLLSGTPRHWWLRSPYVGITYTTRHVNTSGTLTSAYAYITSGLSPACVIY